MYLDINKLWDENSYPPANGDNDFRFMEKDQFIKVIEHISNGASVDGQDEYYKAPDYFMQKLPISYKDGSEIRFHKHIIEDGKHKIKEIDLEYEIMNISGDKFAKVYAHSIDGLDIHFTMEKPILKAKLYNYAMSKEEIAERQKEKDNELRR